MRNGELGALGIDDPRIDDEEELVYVMGKGLKERWGPFNRAALAAIRLHLRMRSKAQSVRQHPDDGCSAVLGRRDCKVFTKCSVSAWLPRPRFDILVLVNLGTGDARERSLGLSPQTS